MNRERSANAFGGGSGREVRMAGNVTCRVNSRHRCLLSAIDIDESVLIIFTAELVCKRTARLRSEMEEQRIDLDGTLFEGCPAKASVLAIQLDNPVGPNRHILIAQRLRKRGIERSLHSVGQQ